MGYVSTHKRIVRGQPGYGNPGYNDPDGPIIEEAGMNAYTEGPRGQKMNEYETLAREKVEATYLVPEVENFVETSAVKKVEDRVRLWFNAGYPVHIIGPTGCGKTTLAMKVAQDIGKPTVWINGDESVTTTDLIGGYSQLEQHSMSDRFVHNVFKQKQILKADWVDNPLTLACKHGYTLVYNEFARTKPEANNILLSVLEEGILELPTKYGEERYVKVGPDFSVIFTSNSIEYAGVHKPQDALLDRMVGIYMDYYDFDTEVKIVRAHTNASEDEAREIVRVVRELRKKLPDAERPGTRACIMVGQGLEVLNGQDNGADVEQLYLDVLATKVTGPDDLSKKEKLVKGILNGKQKT